MEYRKEWKPEAYPSGFEEEFRKRPETQTITFSYYIFRLFARPEEYLSKIIPLYCYEKSSAVGVVRFSVSAGVCWRGQSYCSAECRRAAKRKAHQEAQKRYRRTEKGKEAHREAENLRRVGLTKKNIEILDDTATNFQYRCLKIQVVAASLKENNEFVGVPLLRIGRCHFCGSVGFIVDRFPRRAYGKRNYSMKMAWKM